VWRERNRCNFVIEKPEGSWPLGRAGYRWELNIKTYLKVNFWRFSTDKSGCG
jgi:hypothetical protein